MSWKKYGGIKQLSKANNLNVNSVITDTLTLRNNYDGNFQINGSLLVSPSDSTTTSEINNNLDVSGDLTVKGSVTFGDEINPNQVNVTERLTVSGETVLQGKTTFVNTTDNSNKLFVFGTQDNIGINIIDPSYVLDLCGNQEKLVRFVSNSEQVENVMIQNRDDYGIVFTTDNSTNMIKFYHSDVSLSQDSDTPAAFISYDPSGQMIYDVSKNIQLHTRKLFVNRSGDVNTNDESTVVFYNNHETPESFLSHIDISESTTTGVGLKLVSTDTSSNTFMKTVNRDNNGWSYGGGSYMFDPTRSMGSIGWTDICSVNYVFDNERYIPSQTIVSGNSLVKSRATTGFNTFKPTTENYVMDINGPVKIDHNEIHETAHMPFSLNSISIAKTSDFSIAVGEQYQKNSGSNTTTSSHYFLVSDDHGKQWRSINIDISTADLTFKSYVCDNSFAVVYSSNKKAYYYQNNTFDEQVTNSMDEPSEDHYRYVFKYSASNIYRVFIFKSDTVGANETYQQLKWDFSFNDSGRLNEDGSKSVDISDNNLLNVKINSIDGKSLGDSGGAIYIAGGNQNHGKIIQWNHTFSDWSDNVDVFHTNTDISAYTSIKVVGNHMLAVGGNYISTFNNDIYQDDISFSNVSFNDVFIYDNSCAMAVGDEAVIYYSRDYLNQDWVPLTSDDVNTMGNEQSLFDVSNNIKTVHIDGSYNFIFGCKRDIPDSDINESKIFYCYFPSLFYPDNSPSLLDINGNMKINGYVTGNLKTNSFYTNEIYINNDRTVYQDTINDSTTSYEDSNGSSNDLNRRIIIGDINTRIDISGFLNLLDVSATNIIGGGGGGGGGRTESQVNSQIDTKLNTFHDVSLSVVYDAGQTEVSRTKSKYFFINYDGTYNKSRQTAGAGFYIYNDISAAGGISVDEQLKDGYIRISKYKEGGTAKQDSFSFRATGGEESIRLNIKKISSSISENDKRPLMFINKLDTSQNIDITDATYETLNSFEDDNAEIATDNSYPYIDICGHLHTNNLDFFTRDISMTGTLYANDASFNGNVFVSTDLSVNGDLYVEDISMTGSLYTKDASFNGNVFVSTDLSVNRDLYVENILYLKNDGNVLEVSGNTFTGSEICNILTNGAGFNGGDLSANNADFSGNVTIVEDLTIDKLLVFSSGTDENAITVNGSTYTTTQLQSALIGGGSSGDGATTIKTFSDFYGADAYFTGNVFVTGTINFGVNSSDTTAPQGTTNILSLDDIDAGDASFNGVYVRNILKLSETGGDTVFDVAGLQFSASQVAEVFNSGPGFNGGDLSANNADFSGNVFVSTDLSVNGDLYVEDISMTGILYANDASFNGNVSAASFFSTSDYRVKSNIESLTIREHAIDHLHPVQYILNRSGETQIGFIAHELQEYYPELVSGTKDGKEIQQINYMGMIPVLVKEIQHLRQRVSDLELMMSL